jgi:hypothetical protein
MGFQPQPGHNEHEENFWTTVGSAAWTPYRLDASSLIGIAANIPPIVEYANLVKHEIMEQDYGSGGHPMKDVLKWKYLSPEDRENLRREWYADKPGIIPPEGTPNKKELGDEIDLNEFLKYLSFLDVVPLDPPLDWKPSAQPLVQERRRSGGME